MVDKDDVRDIDIEWKNRVLCSDESCIGTIGADGNCKECGKPYKGGLPGGFDAPDVGSAPSSTDSANHDLEDHLDENDEGVADDDHNPATDDEWARRILCSDESCIGVIDEQTGCCKECGKPYPED